jgi:hypothetical protein
MLKARVEPVLSATRCIDIPDVACLDASTSMGWRILIVSPLAAPNSFMLSNSIEPVPALVDPATDRAACQHRRITSA